MVFLSVQPSWDAEKSDTESSLTVEGILTGKCLKSQQLDKFTAKAPMFLLMFGTPYRKKFKEPATG